MITFGVFRPGKEILLALHNMMKQIQIIALLLATMTALSQSLTLQWTQSTDTNVNYNRLYCWTNTALTNCTVTNAVQIVEMNATTNLTLTNIVPEDYTFGVTAIVSNSTEIVESPMSNLVGWDYPAAPGYLITVEVSSNLVNWVNGPQNFFRLAITTTNE